MTDRKTAQEIDAEAAEWAARVDRGPLAADEEEAFRRWAAEDPRRLGAFGRMRAIWLATEKAKALGPGFAAGKREAPQTGRSSRRLIMGLGIGIAASVVAVSTGGLKLLTRGDRFTSGKGESRVVALSDGSVVTLNTQSELLVGFTQQERRVNLLRGEALFEVAKNHSRPFIAQAGDTLVRAIGTSFTVRHLESTPVQVLVREGVVEISTNRLGQARTLRLLADNRAIVSDTNPGISQLPVSPAEMQRDLAWRDGRIAFEGQSLRDAAAEFSRYSDIRIVVNDPDLAREEIAGLFRATDPVGFAQTVAVSLKAHVEIGENEVRLTR